MTPVYGFLLRRCYASMVYAFVVCQSVCLLHSGITSKRLNTGSFKESYTIAHQGLFSFLMPKTTAKFEWDHSYEGQMQVG